MIFGECCKMNKVKAMRLRKRMSRYRIAKTTGIGYNTLISIESGGDVKLSTLAKIAKVLNVPVTELV